MVLKEERQGHSQASRHTLNGKRTCPKMGVGFLETFVFLTKVNGYIMGEETNI